MESPNYMYGNIFRGIQKILLLKIQFYQNIDGFRQNNSHF